MCTLSWCRDQLSLDVFFNRDEQKARPAARAAHYWRDYQAIFPVDPQGGGTWLAVTTEGSVFALLNNYQASEDLTTNVSLPQLSRGLVITMLLQELQSLQSVDTQSIATYSGYRGSAIEQCLNNLPLHAFRPFILVCLSPGNPELAFNWDGRALASFQPTSPVVSSAVELPTARAVRRDAYPGTEATVRQLINYHSSHQPAPSAFSVCMHRDDAHTVSFSHLHVNQHDIHFHYHAGAPCQTTERSFASDDGKTTVDVTVPRYSDNESPKNSLSCL